MAVEKEMCRGGKEDFNMPDACLSRTNSSSLSFPVIFRVCVPVFCHTEYILYGLLSSYVLFSEMYFISMEYLCFLICCSLLTRNYATVCTWLLKVVGFHWSEELCA